MKLNAKNWSNNCAGLFLIFVVFFIATIALGRSFPSGATSFFLWLFGILGVAALGAWVWLSGQVAEQSGGRNVLLDYRRPRP